MLSLEPYLERRPAELSGGQRQRVAIGRAVVREPKLFLFDEPLSNLDAALRVNTRLEIAQLHRRLKATMIYVTHDQVEAMTLADKIVVLNAGRIEQVGAPMELYNTPANLFVAGFIGSPKMNFIDGARLGETAQDHRRAARAPDRRRRRRRLEGHGHPCRASRRRHQSLSRHGEGRADHRAHLRRLQCRARRDALRHAGTGKDLPVRQRRQGHWHKPPAIASQRLAGSGGWMDEENIAGIADWTVARGLAGDDEITLLQGFCERCVEAGIGHVARHRHHRHAASGL